MSRFTLSTAGLILLAAPALCGDASVTITGTVTQDTYNFGPMNAATMGSIVEVTFEVDLPGTPVTPGVSTDYSVDNATFAVTIDGGAASGSPSGAETLLITNDPVADEFDILGPLTNGDFFGCEFDAMPSFFGSDDISALSGTYSGAGITSSNYRFTGAGGFLGISVDSVVIDAPQTLCVVITGEILSTSYSSGPLGGAMTGDTAIATFNVSSSGTVVAAGSWVNYPLDIASFDFDINGSTGAMLSGPANFGIVDAFPVSDGLQGPMVQFTTGENFGFSMNAMSTLFNTTDITQLIGSYDLAANLTSFGYTIFGNGGFMEIFPETLQIKPVGTDLSDFCFGDGGDQMGCTDCPCGNNAPLGSTGGCINSANGSATLATSGSSSISTQDLCFSMTDATPSSFAVLTSGSSRAPANPMNPCFGLDSGVNASQLDGLRCVVMGVLRHGSRAVDSNGDVGLTNNGWGWCSPLFPNSSFMDGQTRHFQAIYRENPGQVCATEQNSTQGVTVVFSM